MYVVVGLGNPGKEYQDTRHNLGFKVIDELAKRANLSSFKAKHRALVADMTLADHKVILCQPQTFMNLSGEAVKELVSWHKVAPEHIIVAYDDVDLEVGQLRVREGKSSGGHHGIESLIQHLGTPNFIRVRIGISRPSNFADVSEHVLQKIPGSEKQLLDPAIILAADAIEAVILKGLVAAMDQFN